MTLRLTIGCDPGQSGALAVLADGLPIQFIDMPVYPRWYGKGEEVDVHKLPALLRGVLQQHQGAHVMAVLEAVSAMPKQGGTSAFHFGESLGALKGALGALGITFVNVRPPEWKKHFGLIRTKEEREADPNGYKDLARVMAIERFPAIAPQLARKKDGGRADALMIGRWGWETEQYAQQAAA